MLHKNHKLFIAVCLACICMAIGLGGCKKCYECKGLIASFFFVRGIDTIKIAVQHGTQASDTIRHYTNLGYQCDTMLYLYIGDFYPDHLCGKTAYNQVMAAGDICTEVK